MSDFFQSPTDERINEFVSNMDSSEKEQLLKALEIQAAYKKARKMKGTVKKNPLKMQDFVEIVRKIRSQNVRKSA